MLTDQLKDDIRVAYTALMDSKQLTPRWGQRQMIAEIANALGRIPAPGEAPSTEPAVCVIEAGTGTGKTIAYAVSAIPMAQARGKRLVVATATIALQEQFINKDLPDIRHHSGLAFSFALAKGRRRYVCLSKLDRQLIEGQGETGMLALYPDEMASPASADAMPVYSAMIDALGRGQWDGDRDNWPDTIAEEVWWGVTTDHAQCTGRRCPNISQCSFFKAREQLQNADIIVTNHDLALSDLALGGGAILPDPDDCIYVFDEGHHLPDKALSHFASFCRLHTTMSWLQDCKKAFAQAAPVLAPLDNLERLLNALPADVDEMVLGLQGAEQQVAQLFEDVDPEASREDPQVRFDHGVVPEELRQLSVSLAERFDRFVGVLGRIEKVLEDALEDDFSGMDQSELETWHINLGGMLGRAEGVLALWRAFAEGSQPSQPPVARWVTMVTSGGQYAFDLRCSPVLASDILSDNLWSRASGVVITSATITALNSFERFILHSGAPREGRYKQVMSPFDYGNAVFSVPAMDCDPGDAQAHTEAIIDMLPQLLDLNEGSLVLFSSRRQMLDVHAGVTGLLGDRILMQGDYSKQEILRRHREEIDGGFGSVIFGLASFAEGVDLPGDYCRHVVIAKIPFAVPDSPLEAALAEWMEAQGKNPFMEISVPDAALRLVQAAGRLLRTETDTGRVTLLDRRVRTRRYGQAILDSLPPFRRELG
ncbi:ATP-dependent DNA helicase DinG [Halioglobus japonicus]|uniref:ATP-dependent DNA helicase DinG n=1 Tax=Halioglobus japonicus TaxID=930805 RepID=A0AAP8MB34_9GAMM|nr:ATP-dependent DNA helicase DinG [Halioglobus japonicus]PLW84537.1 ATP-dependent DNA helicase DinG [Halioglobus japonicus]GHD24346.1 ATP-dependent DNA helicase DinG [Halioglobus japonicus]